MTLSTKITVDGAPVITSVPRGTKAWRLANSVFCPLGAAPTQAWMLMLKSDLDGLAINGQHAIRWEQVGEDSSPDRTLEFKGLYIVRSQRLLPGGPGDANAIHLIELADGRHLASRNSDSGALRVNLRSYANTTEFLTGTGTTTWANLLSSLWSSCGKLGSFPGLPPDLPIDGKPDSTWLIGINAYRALNAVLDLLDCAIAHDPFADTYSIVQLGATQTPNLTSEFLKWNAEPITPAVSIAAANLNIYFNFHRQSYGQERDTELASNWAYDGQGSVVALATGIGGASGTKPLWDDLAWRLDENNTQMNSAEVNQRVQNRKDRYVKRWTVANAHRVYAGLTSVVLPGGQVRAVIWRNWDDGEESDVGGTVTEFVSRSDLVAGLTPNNSGPAWLDGELTAPERENYSPPDLGRNSYPNYPRLPNVVQLNHATAAIGETVDPNAAGLHRGRVRRWVSGSLATLEECWIRFVDNHDVQLGQVRGIQGELYGPARLSGVETASDDPEAPGGTTLPLYLVRNGVDGMALRVFQLTAEFSAQGQASAKLCQLQGGVYTPIGDPITVVDTFLNGTRFVWTGGAAIGAKGFCLPRSDRKFDVIWMQRFDLFIRFQATEDRLSGSDIIEAKVLDSFQHGNLPPLTFDGEGDTNIFIYDTRTIYPNVLKDAIGLAAWNERTLRYEVVVVQQRALIIRGLLASNGLGAFEQDVQVFSIEAVSPSPFNLLSTPPAKINNPYGHLGQSQDLFLAVWSVSEGVYNIIDVEKKTMLVVSGLRTLNNKYQVNVTTCAVEYINPPAWVDAIIGSTCDEEE